MPVVMRASSHWPKHRWCRAGSLALGVCAVALSLAAQVPWADRVAAAIEERPLEIDRGAAALWQSLLKLHTRASLLMITAHPDDEDGGLLTYESRGRGTRVALLTLTRGESGQNLMTADYFDPMGLLRTEELLAADEYYGTQQYFGRVVDFGFSKSKQETWEKWTEARVLSDAVRVVRLVRPLVIVSVFVGGPSDGHGHHQVAGEVAQRVFTLAGDPRVFPEQLQEGLRPWSPLKMYARVPTFAVQGNRIWDYADGHFYPLRFFNFITGQWIEGQLSADAVIHEGNDDPLLGASYVQVARQGLGMQKSQNGGVAVPPPGPADVGYHCFASRVGAAGNPDSLFSGIDTSLPGIASLVPQAQATFLREGLKALNGLLEQAIEQFDARHPGRLAPLLAQGARQLASLIEQVSTSALPTDAKQDVLHELEIKRAQFNTALGQALRLSVQAEVVPDREPSDALARLRGPAETFRVAVPGQAFSVQVRAANQGDRPVAVRRLWIATSTNEAWRVQAQGSAPTTVAPGGVIAQRFRVEVPLSAAYTQPYFSRPSLQQAYYDLLDARYRNLPLADYPVSGWVEFDYEGVPVRLGQVVQTMQREPGQGPVFDPLVVGPAVSVWVEPHATVVPFGARSFPVSAQVRSAVREPVTGTLRLHLPSGWRAEPVAASFSLGPEQGEWIRFTVYPATLSAQVYRLQAEAEARGQQFRSGFRVVGYPGLRPYYFYREAEIRVTGASVRLAPNLRSAYIAGTGDEVPQALETLGVRPTLLSEEDLASGDLARFDVIVIGERAYSVRPELSLYNQRLLDYVHRGGVVVVQYQSGDFDRHLTPYPLTIGRGQTVTDEDSAVQFLLPEHPLLRWPNRITAQDFRGWIEERGHGFPERWDVHWQALVEMHDPGQDPQRGGLLMAHYGRGYYVYVALALYRQLPEGVVGAYRLFANLLSLARNPLLRGSAPMMPSKPSRM